MVSGYLFMVSGYLFAVVSGQNSLSWLLNIDLPCSNVCNLQNCLEPLRHEPLTCISEVVATSQGASQ